MSESRDQSASIVRWCKVAVIGLIASVIGVYGALVDQGEDPSVPSSPGIQGTASPLSQPASLIVTTPASGPTPEPSGEASIIDPGNAPAPGPSAPPPAQHAPAPTQEAPVSQPTQQPEPPAPVSVNPSIRPGSPGDYSQSEVVPTTSIAPTGPVASTEIAPTGPVEDDSMARSAEAEAS